MKSPNMYERLYFKSECLTCVRRIESVFIYEEKFISLFVKQNVWMVFSSLKSRLTEFMFKTEEYFVVSYLWKNMKSWP